MNRITTRKLVLNGLMIALVFVTTRYTAIPGPIAEGYINLGDAIIMVAAILFGGSTGMIAGAIGSALADVAYGAYIYVPITFLVKGLEGLIIGSIVSKIRSKNYILQFCATILGAVIMVGGYFVAEAFILGLINKEYGFASAVTSLPFNLVQGAASVAVGYSLSLILLRFGIKKQLQL